VRGVREHEVWITSDDSAARANSSVPIVSASMRFPHSRFPLTSSGGVLRSDARRRVGGLHGLLAAAEATAALDRAASDNVDRGSRLCGRLAAAKAAPTLDSAVNDIGGSRLGGFLAAAEAAATLDRAVGDNGGRLRGRLAATKAAPRSTARSATSGFVGSLQLPKRQPRSTARPVTTSAAIAGFVGSLQLPKRHPRSTARPATAATAASPTSVGKPTVLQLPKRQPSAEGALFTTDGARDEGSGADCTTRPAADASRCVSKVHARKTRDKVLTGKKERDKERSAAPHVE
jgi:hypothetical protein